MSAAKAKASRSVPDKDTVVNCIQAKGRKGGGGGGGAEIEPPPKKRARIPVADMPPNGNRGAVAAVAAAGRDRRSKPPGLEMVYYKQLRQLSVRVSFKRGKVSMLGGVAHLGV